MIIYTIAIIEKAGKILLLLRKNASSYSGYYGVPGGKLDANESVADALIREMYEEIGIIITKENMHFTHCLSYKNDQDIEFLSLTFKISHWEGEPFNKEPDKHEHLAWFYPNALPGNLGPRHRQAVEMTFKNILYSEAGW